MEKRNGNQTRHSAEGTILEELHMVRKELDHEQHHYRDLFEWAPDGYLVTSITGKVLEANRAAARMLGAAGATLLDQPLIRFVVEKERTRFEAHLTRLRLQLEARRGGWETSLQPLEGAPFPASMTASPVIDPAGKAIGFRWLVRDITRQKWAEADRERLVRELQAVRTSLATLGRFLPICVSCKQIRDDHGYWQQVEVYLRTHADMEFSHSLCPPCTRRLYPEVHLDDGKDQPRVTTPSLV